MKRGGRLARRTRLVAKTPLRRFTELRRTPRTQGGTSGGEEPGSGATPRSRSRGHRLPAEVRALVAARSGGWCEVQISGCTGRASQMHHRITQKSGGRHGAAADHSDRPSNLLHLDAFCHDVITRSPGASQIVGHALEEWQNPIQEPVLYRGEPMYLTDDGLVVDFETAGA